MDLTKLEIKLDPRYTWSGTPVYLLASGSTKMLVTARYLQERRPDLYDKLHKRRTFYGSGIFVPKNHEAKLAVGKGVKIGKLKAFRVDPTQLSREQRKLLTTPSEGRDARIEFIKTGEEQPVFEPAERVQFVEPNGRRSGLGQLLTSCSPDGVVDIKWDTGATSRCPVGWISRRIESTAIPRRAKRPKFNGVGVTYVAELAKLKPVLIRRFLRLKKIGKRGGRYLFTKDEAAKIARAAKKHYQNEQA